MQRLLESYGKHIYLLLSRKHFEFANRHRDDEEWPRAYVVLKDNAKGQVTESTVQEWIAERVSEYKRLRGGVAFIDEVPKSQSGKIQRKIVREWAESESRLEKQQYRPKL